MSGITGIAYHVAEMKYDVESALQIINEEFESIDEIADIENKLIAVKNILENLFSPSVEEWIEEEGAYEDEMSDRADAAGY